MNLLDILIHLLNFAAPAFVLALLLPLGTRLIASKKPLALSLIKQFAINFVVGLVVLGVNLWWWERDGKMAAYLSMVLVVATCQWLLLRGWRR